MELLATRLPTDGRIMAESHDARKLNFPLPMVASIVGGATGLAIMQYLLMSGLQSDVRDILTRMDATAKLAEVQMKAQDERMRATNDDINEMKRRLELVQLQYQQLRETVLESRRR